MLSRKLTRAGIGRDEGGGSCGDLWPEEDVVSEVVEAPDQIGRGSRPADQGRSLRVPGGEQFWRACETPPPGSCARWPWWRAASLGAPSAGGTCPCRSC